MLEPHRNPPSRTTLEVRLSTEKVAEIVFRVGAKARTHRARRASLKQGKVLAIVQASMMSPLPVKSLLPCSCQGTPPGMSAGRTLKLTRYLCREEFGIKDTAKGLGFWEKG